MKSPALNMALEDALRTIRIDSFEGGLDSETDPADLDLNSSPDTQNCKLLKKGRLIVRGGYSPMVTGLAAVPDGFGFLYDTAGNRHFPVWINGNLYDVVSGAAVLVAAATYTSGNRVAFTDLNNILYYSDGAAALRQWNPATGVEQAVANAGGAGIIAPPATAVLCSYEGQLLAGNNIAAGTPEPSGLRWSNVNDPNRWVGTNVYQVGQGQGGVINSAVPFGIAAEGVAPFKAVFVGKSYQGCYVLTGPTSSFSEVLLNISAGVLDGATVQYIPGPTNGAGSVGGAGTIVLLGTDMRVWFTNGINSGELSAPIRTELSNYIVDQLGTGQRLFTGGVNMLANQFILDVGGGRQYIYDWNNKAWMRYIGWPSGRWLSVPNAQGIPITLVADTSATHRICQVDVGLSDNNNLIDAYWTTPHIHGGIPDINKVWKFVTTEYATDIANVILTGTTSIGDVDTETIAAPVSGAAAPLVWDVGSWDSAFWTSASLLNYTLYKKKLRFVRQSTEQNANTSLRGDWIQVKVSKSVIQAYLEIRSIELQYYARGRRQVAR